MNAPTSSHRSPAIAESVAELQQMMRAERQQGKTIGLVPTMGALHAGHVSLVQAARRDCQVVVTSIFVNPTQFGPGEDFERYPRNLAADVALLEPHGVSLVFAPPAAEIYRSADPTTVEPAPVAAALEGAFRPVHFRGVATVVLKLVSILVTTT